MLVLWFYWDETQNSGDRRKLKMEVPCSLQNQPHAPMDIICTPMKQCISGMEITFLSPKDSGSEQCKPSRKRRVRFAPSTVFEYTRSSSCDDLLPVEQEKLELWWNRKDFDAIMSKAMTTASEARHQPVVVAGLGQAFQLALRTASLVGQECQLDECLQNMHEEHRGLKLWCQYGHSRRGLEKYTSRQYNDIRRKQMHKLYKRVVALSKQGADPEEIRHVAERTSRLSVIFARMMAIADANASNSIAQPPNNIPRANAVDKSNSIIQVPKIPSPVLSVKHLSPVNRVRKEF